MKNLKLLSIAAVAATVLATHASAANYNVGVQGGSINGINDVQVKGEFVETLGLTKFDFISGDMSFSKEKQAKGSLNYIYQLNQDRLVGDSVMYLKVGAGAEMFKYDSKIIDPNCQDDCQEVDSRKSKAQAFGSIAVINFWNNDFITEIGAEIGSEKTEAAFTVDYKVSKDTTLTATVGKSFSRNSDIDFDKANVIVGFKHSF